MTALEEVIHSRQLNACHVLVASLLSGFSEIGVLNQGVITTITSKIASHLKIWFDAKGLNPNIRVDDPPKIRVEKVMTLMNEALKLTGETHVSDSEKGPVFQITSGKCRICPIGVGEAEIPGTACPFPGLLTHLTRLYSPDGKGVKIKPVDYHILTKKNGSCHIYLEESSV